MSQGAVPQMLTYLHERGRRLGLPTAGTFELTARCNFNCKMCYVHLTEEEQRRRGQELTAEEWIALGEAAAKAGTIFLLLTGGEPTLRPDFAEIYRALHKMGMMISVNSNGYLMDEKAVALFREETPTRVNISLYGTENETYRRLCGMPAYDRIVRNIGALREAGIEVKVNLSLTPDNIGEMEKIVAQARSMDAQIQATPYMFPPVRRDLGSVGENFRMPPEQAGEFQARYNLLTMSRDQFCLLAFQMSQGIAQSDVADCEGNPGKGMACRAGSSSFWMTWDGKMMPCGQMREPAFDVKAMGFDTAWQETRKASAAIRLPQECANCSLSFLCHACAAMCYGETGRFDGKPEYLCRLNRSYLEQTLRLWKEHYGEARP